MALKALMLRKTLNGYQAELSALRSEGESLRNREKELETALDEAKTDEELETVRGEIEQYETDKRTNEEAIASMQAKIDSAEEELRALEQAAPPPRKETPPSGEERKDETSMPNKRAFPGMTSEQRDALLARGDVKEFLTRFREIFAHNRAVSGGELLIPTVVLNLLRENISWYSRLIRHVRLVNVSGKARQPIMGTVPEAVWTEMCAALNELNFTLNQVDVDGYKVGGYVAICNALLADTDGVLLSEIVSGLGGAIGKALDKAILYGAGTRMPMGIATRLAQTAAPSDYPSDARPWQNLSQSNVITIQSSRAAGITLFQDFVQAASAAKGRYSRGSRWWAMNEATHTKLLVEAMSINSAGAIVSAQGNTMPVIGGSIELLDDTIIPDNTIIGGYDDLYLLAERAGTSVAHSDIPLFIQEQTVVKASARYDGKPVIPEGFVAIGIGAAPTMTAQFPPDLANPAVAALSMLSIGSLALTPAFSAGTASYSATTSNDSDLVTAVPSTGGTVTVTVNNSRIQNGTAAVWKTGSNTVAVTVTNGSLAKTYTVAVTKQEDND